jgi:hypothetical protein
MRRREFIAGLGSLPGILSARQQAGAIRIARLSNRTRAKDLEIRVQ